MPHRQGHYRSVNIGGRARNTSKTRANMTGNSPSTRMSRGRGAASTLMANSNNNRIMAQNRIRTPKALGRSIGSNQMGKPAKTPPGYKKIRVERTAFASKGQSRYKDMWCPPGVNTITHQCVEASATGAKQNFIAQTSGIVKGANRTPGPKRQRRQGGAPGVRRGGTGGGTGGSRY